MAADASAIEGGRFDAVVVVSSAPVQTGYPAIDDRLAEVRPIDLRLDQETGFLPCSAVAGGRLVVAPTGRIDRDGDDVRRFGDAARLGIRRAVAAGARRPLLIVKGAPWEPAFRFAGEVALLEAAGACWAPLEAREARESAEPVEAIGWLVDDRLEGERRARLIAVLEDARRVARDVTGTEPERMAPSFIAKEARALFRGGPVSVEIIDDVRILGQEYPLLSAVARASLSVPRHRPCVLRLEYVGEGPEEQAFLLAGKGVTYDTGGADVKYGGAMAGMSRDKGGAGAVLGLMRVLDRLRPRGLRVIAEIGAVRNSVGADAFVTDEILVSHAGVRVRVGNTDAEGRLVLADLLSHLRVRALSLPRPRIFTFATLTGHAGRAVGPYAIALDNDPARVDRTAERLAEVGDLWGDPFEVSRLRREDWDFVRPRSAADDVLSCNNAPSSATPRGHQFPMAFLALASGLDRHGRGGQPPLPFTHIDIGGAALEGGDWQHGRPTGTPVVAFSLGFFGVS